jgi:hypothetical protein
MPCQSSIQRAFAGREAVTMNDSSKITATLLPRLIRLRDAPYYLGMDRNRFNSEVRPLLIEIPIGEQGIAFDRLDLEAWADDYKSRNGRPGQSRGVMTWDARERRASSNAEESGTSTSKFEDTEFAKALARAISPGRTNTSPGGSRKSAKRPSTE